MPKKIASLTCLLLVLAATAALADGSPKQDDPGEAYALYNEGVDLMQAGDYAAAQKRFQAALAKEADFAEAHNNLGYSLRKQGEAHFDDALLHYNRALELDPELAQAYMYRGVLHVLRGDEERAKADHAALVELDRGLAEQLLQVIATGEEPEGDAGLAPAWDGGP